MAGTTRPLVYPSAAAGDQIDEYNGVRVAAPYQWLEDPDSPATRVWIADQRRLAEDWLAAVPQKSAMQARIKELQSTDAAEVPTKEGGRYFYSRTEPGSAGTFCVADAPDAAPRVVLEGAILAGTAVSSDGRHVAYGVSHAGAAGTTWRVHEVDSGRDSPEVLERVTSVPPAWDLTGNGFYYSRFDDSRPVESPASSEPLPSQRIWFHRLGTDQANDVLVYARPDHPEWMYVSEVSQDGRYLIVSVPAGAVPRHRIFYKVLSESDSTVVELTRDFGAGYGFVDNDGPVLWFITTLDAPRAKVIRIDTRDPAPEQWTDVIPEAADALTSVFTVGDRFVGTYLRDAHSEIRVFDLSGKQMRTVQLPEIGTVAGLSGARSDPEALFSFTSFATPPTIYRYNVASNQLGAIGTPRVGLRPDEYTTEQVFCIAADGVRVPMFIAHRRDVRPCEGSPTILTCNGGFGISEVPAFFAPNMVWMEMGGVYAVAGIRGGGEYGEAWHQAGIGAGKQVAVDDFLAAARWLIANKYTSKARLAISGARNGGLVVAASMMQHPELFGACISEGGILDLLRFPKLGRGQSWIREYGSPQTPREFAWLSKLSPLHNISSRMCYPPTLVVTSDSDQRVVPAHSYKFVAALQAAQGCENPVLAHIEVTEAGSPQTIGINSEASELAFLVRALRMEAKGICTDRPVMEDQSRGKSQHSRTRI